MRLRSLSRWDSIETSKSLLYFAQLLDELLFDYSLDTYKPSAMHTSLLCSEALETISEIDKGNIKLPNLHHICDELCANLQKDHTSKELVKFDLGDISAVLKNRKTPVNEKKVLIELLFSQLSPEKYKKKNEELLVAEILKTDFSQSKIRYLARSYITTLINTGYSSKYINDTVHQFFFYGSNRISGNSAINDFIEKFTKGHDEFIVLYRGSTVFESIEKACNSLGVLITPKPSDIGFDVSNLNFELRDGEVYICVKNIRAQDKYSAKKEADGILDVLSTLFTLFHHKRHLEYRHDHLVFNKSTSSASKLNKNINTMHKCIDTKPPQAALKLNSFVSDFSLERNSFNKFNRSAVLHSLALASDSTENQMINLWIALESIIPPKYEEKDISTIEHIINSVIPFLNLGYIERLISRLTTDLVNWNKPLLSGVLSDIDGDSWSEKVLKLLALSEYSNKNTNILPKFKDFHLLSSRFRYLSSVTSDPKKVINLLDNHKQRVEWQIRRIYRARNLIVHSGNTPTYTEILIVNTHDYLDTVMRRLMSLASKPKAISSVAQGFKHIELTYKSYYNWLKEPTLVFSTDNISKLLFENEI